MLHSNRQKSSLLITQKSFTSFEIKDLIMLTPQRTIFDKHQTEMLPNMVRAARLSY